MTRTNLALRDYHTYKAFIDQNLKIKPKKKETDDVLSKPPLRYLAYSNEIGAAISPISKTAGTILWAPALLYLGADIYDKYKNEDKVYMPSAKRSVKQALFQGFASVLMPTAAIKAGQNVAVRMFKHKGEELNALEMKELVEFTSNYLQNNSIKPEEFGSSLTSFFKQQASANEAKIKSRTFVQKLSSVFSEGNGYERTFDKYIKNPSDDNPVISYLTRQAKLVNQVLSGDITNDKYIRFCKNSAKRLGSEEIARKETALKILKSKNINKSKVATIGGLITLVLLAKPIDYFVENILMEKVVDPLLNKYQKKPKEEKTLQEKK